MREKQTTAFPLGMLLNTTSSLRNPQIGIKSTRMQIYRSASIIHIFNTKLQTLQ